MALLDPIISKLTDDGFVVLRKVYSSDQIGSMLDGMTGIYQHEQETAAIRRNAGSVYAARNVLEIWPTAANVWQQPPLPEILARVLGADFGLVRALFFDKPPARSWTLPWHRDLTIAVRDNSLPSSIFSKPTRKAGVPHVEAHRAILDQMLTVRIHLDDVSEENGPLKVQAGSHREHGGIGTCTGESVLAERGDVLLMRPLLVHGSGHAQAGTARHRRIVHFEFAAAPFLPDGYEWYEFHAGLPMDAATHF